jgi:hypothetical protein
MKDRHAGARDRSDYQEHEAQYFGRHARPVSPRESGEGEHDPHFRRWREEHLNALDEDYRLWRQDRYRRFGEAFDRWRASRPARGGAAGSHSLPPSEGTDPGQPNSAAPGASGKNK